MDLHTLVPSLQRATAPPGQFATLFPLATDDEMAARLADAAAEAQMDGFLGHLTVDPTALTLSPDPVAPGIGAVLVLYAKCQIIQSQLANMKTRARYKAGPVESDVESASGMLQEVLRELDGRKKDLIKYARAGQLGKAFGMADAYVAQSVGLLDPYFGNMAIDLGPFGFEPAYGFPLGY